jgi:hypothetical protein
MKRPAEEGKEIFSLHQNWKLLLVHRLENFVLLYIIAK